MDNARHAGVALDAIEGLARELGGAGESARRITVVGTVRDVGTTMTAITLARSLARQARVVLVDLSLGAPQPRRSSPTIRPRRASPSWCRARRRSARSSPATDTPGST